MPEPRQGKDVKRLPHLKMEAIQNQLSELTKNQRHILESIQFLNERIKDNADKVKEDESEEVENIIETQSMIDQIIVKNSDDRLIIKKIKEENAIAIKLLENKIDKIDKDITKQAVKTKTDMAKKRFKSVDSVNSIEYKLCEKTFVRFVDLEMHIKTDYSKHQIFECEKCEKDFVIE